MKKATVNKSSNKPDWPKYIVKSATDIVLVAITLIFVVGGIYFANFGGPSSPRKASIDCAVKAPAVVLPSDKAKVDAALAACKTAVQKNLLEIRLESQAAWGQFGDYIGGVLNPLLSFFALYVLMRNLQLQQFQVQQTEASLKEVSRGNEIAALAAALEVISEDLRQMQVPGFSNHEAYKKALDLKTWLAKEIANRAQEMGNEKPD